MRGKTRLKYILAAMACLALLSFTAAGLEKQRPGINAWNQLNSLVRIGTVNMVMDLSSRDMVDPAIDDGATFSYFARPSFQIGIRGEQQATQVIDGHLWTGAAEWFAIAGPDDEVVNKRIWTLRDGYLPQVGYSIIKDGVRYKVAFFQFRLNDDPGSDAVDFARVEAENISDESREAAFGGGFMYGPTDHRCQNIRRMKFNPFWSYEMTDKAAVRDGKLIYAWQDRPDSVLAKPGKEYEGPFTGAGRTTPLCMARYKRTLAPGESARADFVIPQLPMDPAKVDELTAADYDERLEAMADYWNAWLEGGTSISVSEKKIRDACRAYVIHALMSQNVLGEDEVEQHVNRLQYNRFWLRDSAFFVSMYEKWGQPEVARALCRRCYGSQLEDGNFLSNRGQLDGWGQSMWAFGTHVRYTGDVEFAQEAAPRVERAAAWLESALARDAWGVMPPTDALDNETIYGRYTGHNFWAIIGLEAAADVMEAAGRPEKAAEYRELREEYRARLIDLLRAIMEERGGVITPGLDVKGGTDWGNLLAVYPGRVLDPWDPLVTDTFDKVREERMQEGISMWHQSLHLYITERVAQTALVRNEQEKAVGDFYGMLLHTGSCHEGFEWTVYPWAGRDYCMDPLSDHHCNFPPHGWYAADMNILFRNMLIREDEGKVVLFSALSPAWARPGDAVEVRDAPAYVRDEAGRPLPLTISFKAVFADRSVHIEYGAEAMKDGASGPADNALIMRRPYFLGLESASLDGRAMEVGDDLWLPLGKHELEITFQRKPAEQKSHEASVKWYKDEYRRRWESSGK